MKLLDIRVSVEQLMLDPNNYRLNYEGEPTNIFDIDVASYQDQVMEALEKERLGELRDSIIENGFLEVDRIVVRRLNVDVQPTRYLVIEGNRRAAAFKGLIEDHKEGYLTLPNELIEKSRSIGVICIEGSESEIRDYSNTLMGIRHVSGPKKWAGLQSAKLIYDMRLSGKKLSEIGKLLGITDKDAGRRYRGYVAFKQMKDDPQYGSHVNTHHYALLLEFIGGSTKARQWLAWSDENGFEHKENKQRLYKALCNLDGYVEIKNPNDAREFQKYLEIPEYELLINSGETISNFPDLQQSVKGAKKVISNFSRFLDNISSFTINEIDIVELESILSKLELEISELRGALK
uniref:hypothetical protein n=1 Tax=Rheinheimera sp. TaxID=1869214 RepID=UPI004047C80E